MAAPKKSIKKSPGRGRPPKVNVKITKKVKKETVKKSAPQKEKQTRIEILSTIANETGLGRAEVESVFDSLATLMEGHLKKKGSGSFMIPKAGIKIERVKKRASKARKMISPLTNKEVTCAAKPARFAVKVKALAKLKAMADA